MESRKMIVASALALGLFACGDSGGSSNGANNGNNGSNNGANNGGGSNNGANNGAGECAHGQFTATEPFSGNEDFIFDFEQPVGWQYDEFPAGDTIDSTVEPKDADGFNFDPRILMRVTWSMKPLENVDAWKNTQASIYVGEPREIDYGGEPLTVFVSGDEQPMVAMSAAIPHDGNHHILDALFQQSPHCEGERLALRELFIDSLAPNEDTTFGQ